MPGGRPAPSGRLVRARDPFGNGYDIAYFADSWTLTDTDGRTQTVLLGNVPHYGKAVSALQLSAFGGATSTYGLSYEFAQVPRSCLDDDDGTSPTVLLPLFTGATLPDGSSYSVPLSSYCLVPELCPNGTPRQGLPHQVVLPTLGRIEWEFTRYELPVQIELIDEPDNPPTWLQNLTGVWRRTLRDPSGAIEGQWTYQQTLLFGAESEESITAVTSPLGDRTDHYFNVGKTQRLRFGLPYTPLTSHPVRGDLLLSNRAFDCDAAGANCIAKRSTYLKYRTDELPLGWVELNPQAEATLTRFHDDSDRWAAVDASNSDGLGHFRQQVTSGNYGSGDVRSVFTAFNPGAGTYPGSFVLPSPAGPWILGTFERIDTSEAGVTARSEHCFDPQTGFLRRTRTLATGTTRGASDLLAVHDPGGAGHRAVERFYGGDLQAIDSHPTTPLCQVALPAAAAYEIRNSVAFGSLATSRYLDGATPTPFLSVDRDIDPSTGLVSRSRDVSGIATDYLYDLMGRPTWIRPALGHDGWTEAVYTRATSPAALASVRVLRRGNGSAVAPVLAESVSELDGFGRLWRESRRMPGGSVWSTRETRYDGNGWRASISEWGHLAQRTLFEGYDPFGRPATITPPDGFDHRIELEYLGNRQLLRRSWVGAIAGEAGRAIEVPSVTIERFDRQGRLGEVVEPSGAGGATATTTYGYDVGNRLRQASTAAPIGQGTVTQNRFWTYDQRGLLLSEQHPEKGESGNGMVTYSGFDARGHATRKVDGPHDLTYHFDRAERLTRVQETGGGARTLKEFFYSPTPGPSLGQLVEASRFNHVLLSGQPVTAQVREIYEHFGRGGRVSRRTTEVYLDGAGPTDRWTQGFEYTPLGVVDLLEYPHCEAGGCLDGAAFPEVEFLFSQGWLTTVRTPSGILFGNVTYHPNGMVAQVQHGNGVTVTHGLDPHGMLRPASIGTTGVSAAGNWTSGPYRFDGSGNVVEIGETSYLYDRVSRVTESRVSVAARARPRLLDLIFADDFESGDTSAWGGTPPPPERVQQFAYDPFGNLIEVVGNPGREIPVNPATNRLLGMMIHYDAAGNLDRWNGNEYDFGPFGEVWRVETSNQEWLHAYTAQDERLLSWQVGGAEKIRWTLRGLDNQVLREFVYDRPTATGVVERDNVHRGPGGPLLRSQGPLQTTHFHVDHLGTPRLLTDHAGAQVAFHAYFPYGEEATSATQNLIRYKFTGHERDLGDPTSTADDLDHMHARMHNPQIGRFLSVDPVLQVGRAQRMPQLWNRYSYALSNPLAYVDPTGLYVVTSDKGLEGLREALVEAGDTATLQLEEVEVTHSLLGLKWTTTETHLSSGDVDLTKSENPTARLIGSAIAAKERVELEVTSRDLAKWQGARTDPTYANKIKILINPSQVTSMALTGTPTSGPFAGVKVGLPYSLGTAVVHELGHAFGYFAAGANPLQPGSTDSFALRYENLHRELLAKPPFSPLTREKH